MATFCTKCGAGLSSETQFCTACGTPVAAVPVAPAEPDAATGFAPVPTPQYQQVSSPSSAGGSYYPPAPVAAPPQKSGGALKIILIVIGVVVLLAILIVSALSFTVWRMARSVVHVDSTSNGGQVTVHTPGGSITANSETAYSAEELGVPIYPGATVGRGGMKMDLPTGSMVTGIYVTGDSKDQVLAFYKSKMGDNTSTYDTSNGAVIQTAKGQEESVIVTITANSSENEGKTQIGIVHTKSKKP